MLILCSLFLRVCAIFVFVFFFKQKTAYEMRISDWSSDVCSSDLGAPRRIGASPAARPTAPGRRCAGTQDSEPDPTGRIGSAKAWITCRRGKIGRASCRERVCQYV